MDDLGETHHFGKPVIGFDDIKDWFSGFHIEKIPTRLDYILNRFGLLISSKIMGNWVENLSEISPEQPPVVFFLVHFPWRPNHKRNGRFLRFFRERLGFVSPIGYVFPTERRHPRMNPLGTSGFADTQGCGAIELSCFSLILEDFATWFMHLIQKKHGQGFFLPTLKNNAGLQPSVSSISTFKLLELAAILAEKVFRYGWHLGEWWNDSIHERTFKTARNWKFSLQNFDCLTICLSFSFHKI